MGKIVFNDGTTYSVAVSGMLFCFDGDLDLSIFSDKTNLTLYPNEESIMSFDYTNPIAQIVNKEDGKTYFKLFSDPRKFEVNRSLDNEKEMSLIRSVVKVSAQSFTDEQALAVKDIYDPFEVGRSYSQNEFFTYNGDLYKVNQAHTSQDQWVPGETGTESLYTKVVLNSSGYPIWKQPTGAHDAYNIGDIVEYKGTLYKSLIDGNVWAPDSYPQGWEIYTEE